LKGAALKLLRRSGAFTLLRRANRSRALVLTYHRFGDGPGKTSARAFDEQVRFLVGHYRVVPLEEIARRAAAGAGFEPATAAITIDDGYADAHAVAFPVLRRCWLWTDKMRFVTSSASGRELTAEVCGEPLRLTLGGAASRLEAAARVNSILKRLPGAEREGEIARVAAAAGVEIPALPPEEFAPIGWDEAREMDAAGLRIGSHTVTHPILTHCGDAELRRELAASRARLEAALGREVPLFCYPNGDGDARVRAEVGRAGYAAAVTVEHGFVEAGCDPLAMPRVHTEEDFTRFLQRTSGFEEVKNRLRGARPASGGSPAYDY
jgi:hypothetical protein